MLFLENFAPLVNSFEPGHCKPTSVSPISFALAQIKTQLALQQLNAIASHSSTPPYTLLNQAFLKIAMSRPRFNPRGNFPLQRPRAPNPSEMRPPGPFKRPGSMGLPRFYPSRESPWNSTQICLPWILSEYGTTENECSGNSTPNWFKIDSKKNWIFMKTKEGEALKVADGMMSLIYLHQWWSRVL